MRYWLMKTEPDGFSIDDLVRRKVEPWTGVRNYTARNTMRDLMQVGDGVLFYHSSCPEPGVAGLARVASAPFPDPTQFVRKSPYYDARSTRAEPRWPAGPAALIANDSASGKRAAAPRPRTNSPPMATVALPAPR